MPELTKLSILQLLQLHDGILEELRDREVVRSSNNPVADYAEWLAARGLNLTLQGRSNAGFDALDGQNRRIEIKSRRVTRHNDSVQLGQLRRLQDRPFDLLLGIVFNADFSVAYAGLVPIEVVVERARFTEHTNAYVFHMEREVLADPRVEDVTRAIAPDNG